jgi:phosphoribosyl 1,2-cyclic phosphodiesterase
MKTAALSSGSSGNCFYIEKDGSAVLIDAGINAKAINERLGILKLRPANIKGIFITHEHTDHIRGADVFARQLKIPLYATKGTIKNTFLCSDDSLINQIKKDEVVRMFGLDIEAFSKSHNAAEPVSYTVSDKNKMVSVITDIGYSCDNVNAAISRSNFLFLESNHDLTMLKNGPYPMFLKSWIKSNSGHLSNDQASLAVLEYANPKLRNVVLSHLSEINNTPQTALKTFNKLLRERKNFNADVSVSLRTDPTRMFNIV